MPQKVVPQVTIVKDPADASDPGWHQNSGIAPTLPLVVVQFASGADAGFQTCFSKSSLRENPAESGLYDITAYCGITRNPALANDPQYRPGTVLVSFGLPENGLVTCLFQSDLANARGR